MSAPPDGPPPPPPRPPAPPPPPAPAARPVPATRPADDAPQKPGVLARAREAVAGTDPEKMFGPLGAGLARRVHDRMSGRVQLERLILDAGTERAVLEATGCEGLITAGSLVSDHPDGFPPALAEQVTTFHQRLSESIVAQNTACVVVTVTDDERPVVDFLRIQSRLRERLPLRVMHTCRACRHTRVVNPDFKKLVDRQKRNQILGSMGMIFTGSSMTPYLMVGRLLQTRSSKLDNVCPRCQGMESDTRMVTFCPRCGDRREESALRTCRKCRLDLRAGLEPEDFWRPPAEVPLAAPPSSPPTSGASAVLPAGVPSPPGARPSPASGLYVRPQAPRAAASPPGQGWFRDPQNPIQHRWWDGSDWTDHATVDGTPFLDPLRPPAP